MSTDFGRILDEAIRKTGLERYRYLCTEHPSEAVRARYRKLVARIVGSEPLSLIRKATSLVGAVGRVVAAVVKGDPIRVPAEILEQRRAICKACPQHDPDRGRCRVCGCTAVKLELATEECPVGKWKATT